MKRRLRRPPGERPPHLAPDVWEQATLLERADVRWHRVADLVERIGSALRVVSGEWGFLDAADAELATTLHRTAPSRAVRWCAMSRLSGTGPAGTCGC
ncbi:MAG: hypothetical protein ACRD0K_01875 [Egibacteraceae bacterium]